MVVFKSWSRVLILTLAVPAVFADSSVLQNPSKPQSPTAKAQTDQKKPEKNAQRGAKISNKVSKSDEEWKKELTPIQYQVARKKGTEPAFTGQYWNNHAPGKYFCVCCGAELFTSDNKFDSGCGWPSFDRPAPGAAIAENKDTSHGMIRTEVICDKCGAHLGHVFPDGPPTTGMRYCINSASLKFDKKK